MAGFVTMDQVLGILDTMTANLIEAHMSELEDNHGGDAEHTGEAPEACSYCRDINTARGVLEDAGRDRQHPHRLD